MGKEDFEKEINDFMATVEVLDVKFSGTPSSESFNFGGYRIGIIQITKWGR